jgi:hypothetical protein
MGGSFPPMIIFYLQIAKNGAQNLSLQGGEAMRRNPA